MPTPSGSLHVQERAAAACWSGSSCSVIARQRVIEAELPVGLRVEQPERRAPQQRQPARAAAPSCTCPPGNRPITLRISSWNGVKSFNWKWSCRKRRDHQPFHQPHQLVARFQPAVGLVAELQVRDAARVVRIGDRVHAPDAFQVRRRRRRRRPRTAPGMIVHRHLVEAVHARHREREHARAVRDTRPGTRGRSADRR